MSYTTKRRRLRLMKDTLRTLTAGEASAVAGGERQFPTIKHTHPHAPQDTRYCLAGEEP